MRKIILTSMLIMCSFLLFAGGDITESSYNKSEINIELLKPSVPLEATFEDDQDSRLNIDLIKPITPREANFEDDTISQTKKGI
jgi:hypothetical protein